MNSLKSETIIRCIFIFLHFKICINIWPLNRSLTCHGKGVCVTQCSYEPDRATQDGWVLAESLDKQWSTEGGNGKPLQYTCHENLMNCIKSQKIWHQKMNSPRSEGVQHGTGEEQRRIIHSPRMNEAAGPKWIWCSVADASGDEGKIWCCEEQY